MPELCKWEGCTKASQTKEGYCLFHWECDDAGKESLMRW